MTTIERAVEVLERMRGGHFHSNEVEDALQIAVGLMKQIDQISQCAKNIDNLLWICEGGKKK